MYCMDLFLLERKKEAEPNCERDVGSKFYLTCLVAGAAGPSPVSWCQGVGIHATVERQGRPRVSGVIIREGGRGRGRGRRWVR